MRPDAGLPDQQAAAGRRAGSLPAAGRLIACVDLESTGCELAGWPDPAHRLHRALEKDEFTLYCQPILALQGPARYPMGELLVRLREEEDALLPPGEFLPVFEHYRMMPQLDRWVVRRAIRYLSLGTRLPCLTVNLSGQTLDDADFVRFVADQLSNHRVSPEALLFELDEIDTLVRIDAAVRFAEAYRGIGGATMVDGFGRRSVSFAAVRRLGARYVKVDGVITRKLLTSEAALRKMRALLTVSRALGFELVAEFVEEPDLLRRLKALDVGYAQGFGVCQPQPIDSFLAAARGAPRR